MAQTPVTVNPLSLEEMQDIQTTILAMQQEIIKPGSAVQRRDYDLFDSINDALYRITDAIERETLNPKG